jgi:hypothetical protein
MRACQLLKRARRPNVSSLLEQRALVIPREYGIYGCELGSYITRGNFWILRSRSGLKSLAR